MGGLGAGAEGAGGTRPPLARWLRRLSVSCRWRGGSGCASRQPWAGSAPRDAPRDASPPPGQVLLDMVAGIEIEMETAASARGEGVGPGSALLLASLRQDVLKAPARRSARPTSRRIGWLTDWLIEQAPPRRPAGPPARPAEELRWAGRVVDRRRTGSPGTVPSSTPSRRSCSCATSWRAPLPSRRSPYCPSHSHSARSSLSTTSRLAAA